MQIHRNRDKLYPSQATQRTRSLPDVSVTDKAHAGGGLTHVGMNAIDPPMFGSTLTENDIAEQFLEDFQHDSANLNAETVAH
ncbi:hypothetical protein A3746_16430 [Oleibacter sp. HI0075]|nr:hypothetical protein A3746_16430 [Oleibacter sp. HI0075]